MRVRGSSEAIAKAVNIVNKIITGLFLFMIHLSLRSLELATAFQTVAYAKAQKRRSIGRMSHRQYLFGIRDCVPPTFVLLQSLS